MGKTFTANQLVKLVQGVKLIGAEGLVVGIPADVAEALIDAEVDVSQITSF